MSNYHNFDLEFFKSSNAYSLKIRSFAGEAKHDVFLPFTSREIEEFVSEIEGSVHGRESNNTVKKFGKILFDALFQSDIRAIYKSTLDQANAKGDGLRLRFHFQELAEFYHIPWEYLYQSLTNQFVALNRQTPIVRYLDMPRGIQPLRIQPPLRILVIISSPTELAYLDVDEEKQKILKALSSLKNRNLVEVCWLETATVAELQQILRQNKYHVFHFIGHGEFDSHAKQGWLAFEDENELTDRVYAEQLGAILSNHPSLRLVVLNSCQGARSSLVDPFASTAIALVTHGIPAVVAMQFKISDTAAIKFATGFYGSVADGLPVDAAVTEARVGIYSEEDNTVEWGTPVLFMRSSDGMLFDIPQEKASPASESDSNAGKRNIRRRLIIKNRKLKVIARIFTVFILGLVPVFLFTTKQERQIYLKLTAPTFNLILDYDDYNRKLEKQKELLNGTQVDMRAFSIEGFSPFLIAYQNDTEGLTNYTVTPSAIEGSDVEFGIIERNFSITSLTFREQTVFSVGVGKYSTTFDFEPVPCQFDSLWEVDMTIDFGGSFRMKTETANVAPNDNKKLLRTEDLQNAKFLIANDSHIQTFTNFKKWFRVQFDKDSIQTNVLLRDLSLINFNTNRFDHDSKQEIPTLTTGSYSISGSESNEMHPISSQSTFSFVAKKLKLIALKTKNDAIDSEIVGSFSAFEIRRFGEFRNILPSYLSILWGSTAGKVVCGIYITLLLRVLLGVQLFKKLMEIVKSNPLH